MGMATTYLIVVTFASVCYVGFTATWFYLGLYTEWNNIKDAKLMKASLVVAVFCATIIVFFLPYISFKTESLVVTVLSVTFF